MSQVVSNATTVDHHLLDRIPLATLVAKDHDLVERHPASAAAEAAEGGPPRTSARNLEASLSLNLQMADGAF